MAIFQKVVHWASNILKSRTISVEFRGWSPEPPSSNRSSFLSYYCPLVAEIALLWLYWVIKPIRYTVLSVLSTWILYRVVAGFSSRQFRGWCAATFFPSVDLQGLCDSHRDEGGMGLPRELIDEIMRYSDLRTLKSCSLTSRAFYSAARPLIHRRLVLCSVYSAAEKRGLLRYGYIRELDLDLCFGKPQEVLQLKQLQALEAVHTLTIRWMVLDEVLPIFDRCFSQFVPTVRSLSLEQTQCENAHELMEFLCRFPHLDDLELIKSHGPNYQGLGIAPPGSKGLQPLQPLPFGGRLVLDGSGPLVQSLLDLPGGIRFHTIDAHSRIEDLAELPVACSSTLEVLTIRCSDNIFPPNDKEIININLRCNRVLRRFELVVDFAELDILPSFVLKILASISSPHFSEFSLRLLRRYRFGDKSSRETFWGAGWEAVDEDLYARTAQGGGFRFVIQLVTGESTQAAVEARFPLMKSKGSLSITQREPVRPW